MESFIGLVINAFYAIFEAPLHYRALERDKVIGLNNSEHPDRYDNIMCLSAESKKELIENWWMINVCQKNGKLICPKNKDMICRTDASFLGWGAYDLQSGKCTYGRWKVKELGHSINYLELLTVFHALQALYGSYNGIHIQF